MKNSPVKNTRNIPSPIRLLLCVRAGGRCEFDGCNKYLFEHHLTFKEGNFGEAAHVVAFREKGPRGNSSDRPNDINSIENLMLLCPECHKLIDDNPDDYPRNVLEQYKKAHEDRILFLTDFGPESKTTVLQLKAKINGEAVEIPFPDIIKAVAPRYPVNKKGHVIDLTAFDQESEAFYSLAAAQINKEMERFYACGMDTEKTQHVSVFGLAPIPVLIHLGTQLSNKIKTEPYQRHRDTENWTWKNEGIPVEYDFNKIQSGKNSNKVALIISLSGKIILESLVSADINTDFSVYEITLKNNPPTTTFLRLREDLENFKIAYQSALRKIIQEHQGIKELYLFPAVPAPIAILCGRELLSKIDPELVVFDNNINKGGFQFAIRSKKV